MKLAIKKVTRLLGVTMGSMSMLIPGATAQGMGMASTIQITGPDSYNSVNYVSENNCTIINETDLDIETSLNQNATSGDASVNGNTIASSEWNDWNPATWQAHGYSYDQWHSAFMNYLSSMEGQYSSSWNSGGSGGSAHSGNASNSNSTSIGIEIDNSGSSDTCVKTTSTTPNGNTGSNGSSVDTAGPNSNNGAVLGDSTNPRNEAGRIAGLAGASAQNGVGGASSTRSTTTGAGGNGGTGGGGTTNDNHPNTPANSTTQPGTPTHNNPPSHNSTQGTTISTTGPDSTNIISSNQQTNTTVNNSTAISIMQRTNQSSTSGDATVSGNTNSGSAGSGDTGNDNGSEVGVSAQN